MDARNEVLLVGRVAAVPVPRQLPSGDEIAICRLVVDRARGDAGGRRRVDTLECVVWPAGMRRRVLRLAAGDVVEVQGSLRRRFWRAGAGPASSYEVEVTSLRRLAKAGSSR